MDDVVINLPILLNEKAQQIGEWVFLRDGIEIDEVTFAATAGNSTHLHAGDISRIGNLDIQERFGTILDAFEYGAPPHGGIAPGIDRLVMVLAGEENIREVIAFPKNQSGVDLTLDAPSAVSEDQLAELHLRLREED